MPEGRPSRTQLQITQQMIARMAEIEVETGLTRFFNDIGQMVRDSTIQIASATMSTALGSFFLPVGQIGISLAVSAAVAKIQENLKPLDLGLRDDTILKVVDPNQGKVLHERTLRKTIKNVLSEDKQANEDLAKAFIKLQPTIKRVAGTAINIEFPRHVKLLITSDRDKINEIFNGFLHKMDCDF